MSDAAAGRAVVTQDTGFSAWLPSGAGVHAFRTPDEALAAIDRVASDPAREGRAARDLAAASFDSDAVLTALVEAAVTAGRG